MSRILGDKYKNANLNRVMTKQCQHLKTKERKIIIILLRKFEYMFNGTLDTWNTTPAELEVQDDAKLVCYQPYTVPRVKKLMFRKEVKILIGLGILEKANDSKCGAPSFAQPKAKRIVSYS